MPRFFFNIRNGNGLTEDEEGRELDDAAAARAEAVKGIRSIVADEAKSGRIDLAGRIEVTDERGDALFDLAFGDALVVTKPSRRPPRGEGVPEIGGVIEKRLGLIGELDAQDAAALRTLDGEVRDVARGEDLLREGDRPGTSVVVVSGLLYRYNLSAQGRRQIHSVYIASDTPSLETIHLDYMDNNLGALAPSRVGIVTHDELHRVMEERPKLRALIWRETLVQASIFRLWLMRNSQMLAHTQVAHFFCELMTRARAAGVADGDTLELPITQEELGDALGMTGVHVNRTLMILRTGGLIEFRSGRLKVLDWERLAETAEFDPSYLHLRALRPR
ncbi:MAG TPA: Crp/Fnr family transcriptional regulator [Allosphingosinicella sp.]|jgi:CRP-like cAMP-binding protein